MTDKSAALQVAQDRREEEGITTLSTDVRVRFAIVPPALLAEVKSKVKDPKPPMWVDPDKDREMPNYNDPAYLEAMEEAASARGMAIIDALLLFGVELVDGMPEDDRWLRKLALMEKMGHLDLSAYDLDDELEREFLYKKHIAVQIKDYPVITVACSGVVNLEEVKRQAARFRRPEARDADPGSGAEE